MTCTARCVQAAPKIKMLTFSAFLFLALLTINPKRKFRRREAHRRPPKIDLDLFRECQKRHVLPDILRIESIIQISLISDALFQTFHKCCLYFGCVLLSENVTASSISMEEKGIIQDL